MNIPGVHTVPVGESSKLDNDDTKLNQQGTGNAESEMRLMDGTGLQLSSVGGQYLHLFSGLYSLDEAGQLVFGAHNIPYLLDFSSDKVIDLSKVLPASEAGTESASDSSSNNLLPSSPLSQQDNYDANTNTSLTVIHNPATFTGRPIAFEGNFALNSFAIPTSQIGVDNVLATAPAITGSSFAASTVTSSSTLVLPQLASTQSQLSETNSPLIATGSIIDSTAVFVPQINTIGTNGLFTLSNTGQWSFRANNAFDSLNVGQKVSDSFNISSEDGRTSTVQVTINGTNDAAKLGTAVIAMNESDSILQASGTLSISDPDNPETFVAQTNVLGANGVFNLQANGSWTYVANSAFDNLNVGDSLTDSFIVESSDGTTTSVQVTITGSNDQSTLSSSSESLTETDVILSTSGTITVTDPDSDTAIIAQTDTAGTYGTFNIGEDGTWTYIANSAFDSLNIGDSISDSFNVRSTDGTVSTVQVTINGTNDSAILSSATVSLDQTDAAISTSGVLTIADVDNPDVFVAQSNVAGTNGTFNIGTDGVWTYVANESFESLNVGDSVSDTFTVASSDGTTTTVEVTINGTNDAATLSSATETLSETDAALSTGGTLTVSDVDNADSFVAQTNVAGTNGTFNIGTDGVWTYVANDAFDSLNVGDSVSDTFTVASSDGTTTTVEVTINGTNDAANLSSATATLSETDAALSTGGTLTVSDVDNADSFVAQSNVAGTNGTFNIGTDGVWTYVANDAFDSLNVGDSVSDTFTVASSDGTTTTVEVTINGTNDAANLSSATATLSETDAALSTGGTLTVSDVDNADSFVAQTNVAGTNGTFNIGTDGVWTYVANDAFDSLNVGDSVSDTFTVASSDGTTTTVEVTINGTN
ncbi:MAG: VCBS domain-containing protein, partial [Legionellaceae bacterium]|nr:VCBS domain-containing protein [Legionellaceae bacterium]